MATTKKKLIREYDDQGQVIRKECRKCNTIKPINEFYTKGKLSRNNIDGYGHICIVCSKKAWHKQAIDPENRKRWLLQRIKSKCQKENIPFNLDIEDLVIPEKCPIFGIPLRFGVKTKNSFRERRGIRTPDDSPSVDRIFPDKGYVKGNILVVSYRANNLKSNATPEEMIKLAEFYKQFILE